MVAGEQINDLLTEFRKASGNGRLTKKWAPCQGYNDDYVSWRSELIQLTKPMGLAHLFTAEGSVPPSVDECVPSSEWRGGEDSTFE